MSLKTKVKVGHVTTLSEARYCAGMGVDWLGFPVGENGLTPEAYRQLIEWVAGPELVLEVFRSHTLDLEYITEHYPGHYIAIGPRQIDWLSKSQLQFVLVITPADWVTIYGDVMGRSNIRLIEVVGATPSDAATIRAIAAHFPTLVQINRLDQLDEVAGLPSNGISLVGSKEEKPGIQNYGLVADVLEKLED